jgi:hypothetical protein
MGCFFAAIKEQLKQARETFNSEDAAREGALEEAIKAVTQVSSRTCKQPH